MTKEEFLVHLRDILQTEEALSEQTRLAEMEEWDSLSWMTLMAFFDRHFGKRITFEALGRCQTAADVIALADGAIE